MKICVYRKHLPTLTWRLAANRKINDVASSFFFHTVRH